jgi:hypothetical protein
MSGPSTVVPVYFGHSSLSDLSKELKEIIRAYSGRISLAEAVGVLEIVKQELIQEHQ